MYGRHARIWLKSPTIKDLPHKTNKKTKQKQQQQNLNLSSHSVVKSPEVARTFGMVDYVREVTAMKSLKYGQCGLFAHLLFLLILESSIYIYIYIK